MSEHKDGEEKNDSNNSIRDLDSEFDNEVGYDENHTYREHDLDEEVHHYINKLDENDERESNTYVVPSARYDIQDNYVGDLPNDGENLVRDNSMHTLIEEFHSITHLEYDECRMYLNKAKWDLEIATEMYFDCMSGFVTLEGPERNPTTSAVDDDYMNQMIQEREAEEAKEREGKKKDKGKQRVVPEDEVAYDNGKRPIENRTDYYNNMEDYDASKYFRRGDSTFDEDADDERVYTHFQKFQEQVSSQQLEPEVTVEFEDKMLMFCEITGQSSSDATRFLKVASGDLERAVQLFFEARPNFDEVYSQQQPEPQRFTPKESSDYTYYSHYSIFNNNNPHVSADKNGYDNDLVYRFNDFKLVKPPEPCLVCTNNTSAVYKNTIKPICWNTACKRVYEAHRHRCILPLTEIATGALLGTHLTVQQLFKLLQDSDEFASPSLQMFVLHTISDNIGFLEQHPLFVLLPDKFKLMIRNYHTNDAWD